MGDLSDKRGQIWISAVLYVLLISIVIIIVLEAGVPIMDDLRDKSVFIQTRDNFVSLDQHIQAISNAGPGSQRIIPLEIKKGELTIGNSQVKWGMDTGAAVVQPRTSFDLGNLRVGSDSDVNAYENNGMIVLENYYLKAVFSKVGNETNYGPINSSSVLEYITYTKNNATTSGAFSFLIDDSSIDSDGYSKIIDRGYNLGSGKVVFHMNMTGGIEHDLYFILDSRSDYLRVQLI